MLAWTSCQIAYFRATKIDILYITLWWRGPLISVMLEVPETDVTQSVQKH